MLGRRPEALSDDDGQAGSGELVLALFGQMEECDLAPALYSYNDKNQMVGASNAGSISTNTFNAEGLRFSKTVDDVTTWYCYEYSQVIKRIFQGKPRKNLLRSRGFLRGWISRVWLNIDPEQL
ncbi:MAG: hypothetical protein FWG43_02525 [Clostridiales bacterium]|nr:hypothetical protein [Clostridiales bacterium]